MNGDQPFFSLEKNSPIRFSFFIRGEAMRRNTGSVGGMRKAVSDLFKEDRPMIAPNQVHGTTILREHQAFFFPSRPEGDGVFLCDENAEGSLRFADCVPVVLWSVHPSPWILLLHSGFVGTTHNIVGEGIRHVSLRHGPASVSEARAWIGPRIGPCCYSRNTDDIRTRHAMTRLPPETFTQGTSSVTFDLGNAVRFQLIEGGVQERNILIHECCTCCEKEEYYSYRAGDTKERMFLLARIESSTTEFS
jgi:YfiH family protein